MASCRACPTFVTRGGRGTLSKKICPERSACYVGAIITHKPAHSSCGFQRSGSDERGRERFPEVPKRKRVHARDIVDFLKRVAWIAASGWKERTTRVYRRGVPRGTGNGERRAEERREEKRREEREREREREAKTQGFERGTYWRQTVKKGAKGKEEEAVRGIEEQGCGRGEEQRAAGRLSVLRDARSILEGHRGFRVRRMDCSVEGNELRTRRTAFILTWRPRCLMNLIVPLRRGVSPHSAHDYAAEKSDA